MKVQKYTFRGVWSAGSVFLRNAPVRQLTFAVFLALVMPQAGWCQQPQRQHNHRHEYQKEIEALEQQWRDAELNHDAKTIDSLLADDYTGINSNGLLQTKEQALARMRSGAVLFKRMDLTEVKVSVHGETAIVTSRATVESTQNGVERDGVYRYTRVYQHRGGVWKVVNFEATRINPMAQMAIQDATEPETAAAVGGDGKTAAPAQTPSH